MTQYRQGTQHSEQAWNLHGLAVRAAFQIGLFSRSSLQDLPPLEAEIRRRTFWGCVILDRYVSNARLGTELRYQILEYDLWSSAHNPQRLRDYGPAFEL
jgi:hypothetical protein